MKSLAAISIIEGRRGENLEDFQLLELLFRVSSQVSMYDTNVDINFQRERELRLRFVDVGGKEKIWENIGLVQLRLWVRFIRKLRPLLNDVNKNRN